mgnify:CR=1 FL=1
MEFKKQAEEIKRGLDAMSTEVNETPGIKIVITGSQNIRSIEIADHLVNSDNKKRLENDILRSVNAAIKKSQQLAAQKMKDVMPGLPGF